MLTPNQRAFLEEPRYGVLATRNRDGSIQQTVVWYLLEGDAVRISVGAGSVKARNLRRDPTASLAVEAGSTYLTVSGRAAVEPADPDLRRRLAVRYRGPDGADAYLRRRPDAPRATLRLTIDRVYGQGV